jgi:predicted Fe-Mo cluster-binding NifX family protein
MRGKIASVRVCVPITDDGRVDPRWGRASRVAVADVADGAIREWAEFDVGWDTLHDEGTEGAHHARIARFLREQDIAAIAVQHVGPGMQRMLATMGIRIAASGTDDARQALLDAGNLGPEQAPPS